MAWKMSDGPKHPADPRVSPCLPKQKAEEQMADQAAVLRSTGQTDRYGVYVAKYGRGHAVYLRDRNNEVK